MYNRMDYQLVAAYTQSAAAATTWDHTVPTGCTDRIIGGWCQHDDAAAHTCQWQILSPAAVMGIYSVGISRAQYIRDQLYTSLPLPEALVLQAGWKLRFKSDDALAAGKAFVMGLLIERRSGETG